MTTFDYATAEKETVDACNLCGGTETRTVATTDRYGLDVTTVQCLGCGLRYQNPRLTAKASAAFYEHGYRPLLSSFYKVEFKPSMVENDEWRYAAQVSSMLNSHVPRGGTLLDIGGSMGIIAQMFNIRFGTEGMVIDPAVNELAQVRGSRTLRASAEDLAAFPNADMALLCRVIDHLRDPKGVLVKLRAAVPLVFVDALNVDAYPKERRYKLDHPFAFTPTTMRAMLDAAGWTILRDWTHKSRESVAFLCEPRKD